MNQRNFGVKNRQEPLYQPDPETRPDGLMLWAFDVIGGIVWICVIGVLCAIIAAVVIP